MFLFVYYEFFVQYRGVGRTIKMGVKSEAICDHYSARSCHSQDSDRETHNSGHDTGEGECATVTLSIFQPISDIGYLITPAMAIDEICCSVSQLSNGDRSAGDS